MHPIRIGCCGWSYKDWAGQFYPRGLPPGRFLESYASRFDLVEVDSTFYRPPSPRMVEGWRTKTPAGFRFSLKVPQTITHEKVLLDCDGEVSAFLDAIRLLGDKLLCCTLQFGFFNRVLFSKAEAFLDRLDRFLSCWPRDVPVAVEVRNKDWVGAALADCLRAHRAIWVLADQAWMPPPLDVVQSLDVVTGSFAYIRLLGDRAEVDARTTTLDHIVIDRSEQVRGAAEAIRLLAGRVPVVVYVNNHFAGYAPETVRELREALGLLPPANNPPLGDRQPGLFDASAG
jgi:uncharacterized protein YecE (DUF72 family)